MATCPPEKPYKSSTGTCFATQREADAMEIEGGRRRTLKAKTLRRLLKKKGMKTTGKKSTLMKRLKMKGGMLGYMPLGGSGDEVSKVSGGRRRSRRSRRGLFGY